ncbi:hypothetical protein I4U23_015321 [Adineta vaga]|nr:hypothetical protein I4U23_015321 [Adineta vaga]
MREQYTQMIHQVGRNILPCIIASENDMNYRGVGSMFTLYLKDGSTRRTKAPPPEYEIYKNLSHMLLCIYTIISPYFLQPTTSGWEDKLIMVKNKIAVALSTLTCQSNQHEHYRTIACSLFSTILSKEIFPYVTVSMVRAAEIQVASAKPQLESWKSDLQAMNAIEKLFDNKTNIQHKNSTDPLLISLTAAQLRIRAAQSTSKELQKALLHTATLMEIDEKKNTMNESSFDRKYILH